jgi:hypothetical protein
VGRRAFGLGESGGGEEGDDGEGEGLHGFLRDIGG